LSGDGKAVSLSTLDCTLRGALANLIAALAGGIAAVDPGIRNRSPSCSTRLFPFLGTLMLFHFGTAGRAFGDLAIRVRRRKSRGFLVVGCDGKVKGRTFRSLISDHLLQFFRIRFETEI
jgi:hypothetical protein